MLERKKKHYEKIEPWQPAQKTVKLLVVLAQDNTQRGLAESCFELDEFDRGTQSWQLERSRRMGMPRIEPRVAG